MSHPLPERCQLEHAGFSALGSVVFRRAETDGTPVMVVPLGEREAAVPLRALQRELAIGEDSADGRMLGLIAESLDFIAGLHLGDRLPREVLTGDASWDAQSRHLHRATVRLQAQLAAAHQAGAAAPPARIDRLREPEAAVLQAALAHAAAELGLPGPREAGDALAALAHELAYIEALREAMLERIGVIAAALDALATPGLRGDMNRVDALMQSRRLAGIALHRLGERFAEVDAHTEDTLAALRAIDGQRAFIRSSRDWLHRCRLAWDPILLQWRPPPVLLDDAAWSLIGRTYQFLAPRFMPVQEWQVFQATRAARQPRRPEYAMRW